MRSRHPTRRRTVRRAAPAVRRAGPAPSARAGTAPAESAILVGGARDPAEKRAERLADRVLRGSAPAPAISPAPGGAAGGPPGAVRRLCTACSAERGGADESGPESGSVRRMCAECASEEGKTARRAPAPAPGPAPTVAPGAAAAPAPAHAARALGGLGAGRPLGAAARAFFEPRLGQDLSAVRIHDGPAADRAARALDARAFTRGTDIALGAGGRDRATLAHELAHVVTDGEGPARRAPIRRAPPAPAPACEACPVPVAPALDAAITGTVVDKTLADDFGECDWDTAKVTEVSLMQTRKKTCRTCDDGKGGKTEEYEFCPVSFKLRATVDILIDKKKVTDAKADGRKAYRDCTSAGKPNKWVTDADAVKDANLKRKTVAGVTLHEDYHRAVGERLWRERVAARNDIGKLCPYTMEGHVKWIDDLKKAVTTDAETFLKGNPQEANEEQNARTRECGSY